MLTSTHATLETAKRAPSYSQFLGKIVYSLIRWQVVGRLLPVARGNSRDMIWGTKCANVGDCFNLLMIKAITRTLQSGNVHFSCMSRLCQGVANLDDLYLTGGRNMTEAVLAYGQLWRTLFTYCHKGAVSQATSVWATAVCPLTSCEEEQNETGC